MQDKSYIDKLNIIHALFKNKSEEEIEQQLKIYANIADMKIRAITNKSS